MYFFCCHWFVNVHDVTEVTGVNSVRHCAVVVPDSMLRESCCFVRSLLVWYCCTLLFRMPPFSLPVRLHHSDLGMGKRLGRDTPTTQQGNRNGSGQPVEVEASEQDGVIFRIIYCKKHGNSRIVEQETRTHAH